MGKPLEGRKTRCSVGPCRAVAIAICAIPLSLLPVVAGAVETDRITVEDPGTGAIKFKVTSEGNVTAATYVGDGAGLSNVAHWKGTWSSATAYAKDDCVYYGGSSWIALQANSNTQPNVNPASWTVMAQQGATGSVGPQGPQGLPGAAGSPDSQADILAKLAAQTDGTVLSMAQGPSEDVKTPKIRITNASGVQKVVLTPEGRLGLNTATPTSQVEVATEGGVLNSEVKLRVASSTGGVPVFYGVRSGGSLTSPSATPSGKGLFWLGSTGYGTTGWTSALSGLIAFHAAENWTDTASGTEIRFATTAKNTNVRAERMRIADNGNIGIGVTAPAQKLEVNGGVRLNTIAAKPVCDSAARGTFWLTQKGTGVMDALEVCIKDAADTYIWKPVL